jgi:hypothetical protein
MTQAQFDSQDPFETGPQFSIGDTFGLAWGAFRDRYGIILGSTLLWFLITMAVGFVASILDIFVVVASQLTNVFFGIPFGVGASFIGLLCVRGQFAEIGDLFVGFRRYWALVGTGLLVGLIIIAASLPGIAFVVAGSVLLSRQPGNGPGIMLIAGVVLVTVAALVLGSRLAFATLMCVDPRAERPGPITAIKKTWLATGPHMLGIIGLFIVLGAMTLVSMLLLCLPYFFVGMPLLGVTMAAAYELLIGGRFRPPWLVCRSCEYDVSDSVGNCPECGVVIPPAPEDRGEAGIA